MVKQMMQGGGCSCCCTACGVRITGHASVLMGYTFCGAACMEECRTIIEVLES